MAAAGGVGGDVEHALDAARLAEVGAGDVRGADQRGQGRERQFFHRLGPFHQAGASTSDTACLKGGALPCIGRKTITHPVSCQALCGVGKCEVPEQKICSGTLHLSLGIERAKDGLLVAKSDHLMTTFT